MLHIIEIAILFVLFCVPLFGMLTKPATRTLWIVGLIAFAFDFSPHFLQQSALLGAGGFIAFAGALVWEFLQRRQVR